MSMCDYACHYVLMCVSVCHCLVTRVIMSQCVCYTLFLDFISFSLLLFIPLGL